MSDLVLLCLQRGCTIGGPQVPDIKADYVDIASQRLDHLGLGRSAETTDEHARVRSGISRFCGYFAKFFSRDA